jgi:methionyl-tRNA formyltransferase
MRIIFAGTPEFAAAALSAVHQAGHDVALVLTQPDRRAGRGLRPSTSAVKRLALELGLEVRQPQTLKDAAVFGLLARQRADVMVVAAYGLILPAAVLAVPSRGCLNIHASLLPRWRGAAPIQRALLAGDRETGISIMQMDEGLDTGPVLLQEAFPIWDEDTAQSLHDRLAALGARLIVCALGSPGVPVPQDPTKATYAAKIDKNEARIDWSEQAETIEREIRAFNPVPGAWTTYRGAPLKLWRAALAGPIPAAPGSVCETAGGAITVACGGGTAVKLLELQRAGARRLDAAAFLAGSPLAPGEHLGT